MLRAEATERLGAAAAVTRRRPDPTRPDVTRRGLASTAPMDWIDQPTRHPPLRHSLADTALLGCRQRQRESAADPHAW